MSMSMNLPEDTVEDRKGEWMHTFTGKRFFPEDPRVEDVDIEDIANGLALDCRYGGQGRPDRYYSVAEHSVHMATYAYYQLSWPVLACLAVLLHDAAEAYINDLPRSVKRAIGSPYKDLEAAVDTVIFQKFGVAKVFEARKVQIKGLDCRIVPLEKAAIMNIDQPWAYDVFDALPNTEIQCWSPEQAKHHFMSMFRILTEGETYD
jgi:hypothetical protein